MSSKREREEQTGSRLHTEVAPAGPFYSAEDYHQKHTLRGFAAILAEVRRHFSSEQTFEKSTEAARLNGYLAGYGDCDAAKKNISAFGLSPDAEREVLTRVCGSAAAVTCPLPASQSAE